MFRPIFIQEINCFSPLGLNLEMNWENLLAGKTGITKQEVGTFHDVFVGKIDETLFAHLFPQDNYTLLEKMLLLAAQPLLEKRTPSAKTGLILSTTKGNIGYLRSGDVEEAQLTVLARKIASALGISPEPVIVSHACVSGLLAVAVGKRMIQMGQFDDVIVLAADVVSDFVVSGFQAFQAMSSVPCKPFDRDRAGVSLGEAAAAVYLSKEEGPFRILGEGAINDANHISGPSRTGEGLCQSVLAAIQEANIPLESIDFISAHGTATAYNDEMEAIAFDRLGLADKPINSLKGYYGHTLGASGLLETVVSLKAMEQGVWLPTLGFENLGVSKTVNIVSRKEHRNIKRLLKTASGFGGSNAAMIIEKN